ncbi:MAG: hypothetical protein IJ233_09615 [Pyramidobacter sp.]|nr:hypothetical protein [Pyramidobacter sp.]
MKKIFALFAVCAVMASSAFAADYPSRAVTINTSKSGSQVDYIARAFAKSARNHFPENLIVNSTSGQINAYRETMRANPDGYALGIVNNTVVINDVVGSTDFDSVEDVEFVGVIGSAVGNWIAIKKELADKGGIKTLNDLIAYTQKHPDDLIITDRTASNTNTVVRQLEALGLKATPADAGTATDRLTNFLSGNCDIFVGAYGLLDQYVKKGDVVCLATCADARSKFSPDVPCSAELGYKGLGAPVYYYLFAPKGLNADAKAKLMKLCQDVAADPTFEKDVANNTIEPFCKVGDEAHEFFAAAKAEMIRLGMGEGYKK